MKQNESFIWWTKKPTIKFEKKNFMVLENKQKSLVKDVCAMVYDSDKSFRSIMQARGLVEMLLVVHCFV